MLYELINPSDGYTFEAPSIEIAGVCAVLLSPSYGAVQVDGSEHTPVMFGWDEWLSDRDIDSAWIDRNALAIADAFDSFLIGDASTRADVEAMLAAVPAEQRQQVRDERQERQRGSIRNIGGQAYAIAKRLRANAALPTEAESVSANSITE